MQSVHFFETLVEISRRRFLGARSSRGNQPIRPPWAQEESSFIESCSRCGDCLKACPTGLLQAGTGGFPEAVFSMARVCTFCAECVRVCAPQALRRSESVPPWSLQVEFGTGCLARQAVVCRTCGESCDSAAIHFPPRLGGVALPQLDAASCTGCGDCIADCPTQAIAMRHSAAPVSSSALQGVA